METYINERIEKVIRFSGKSINEYAEWVGIPEQVLKSYVDGETEPSLESILIIVDKEKNVSLEWLVQGDDYTIAKHRKFVEVTRTDSEKPICIINVDKIVKIESKYGKQAIFYLDDGTYIESTFSHDTVRFLLGINYPLK